MARNRNEEPTGTPGISSYETNSGKRYKVVVDVGSQGRRTQESKQGFRTKKEAEAWRAEKLVGRQAGKPIPGRETVEAFAKRWLVFCEGQVKPGTVHLYDGTLRVRVLPVLGKKRLDKVTTDDVQGLIDGLTGSLKAQTVRSTYRMVRRMFALAVQWKVLAENPAVGVVPPKAERYQGVVWTVEECRRFLEGTRGTTWGELWAVLLGTGMRIGEAMALRWSDVDLGEGTVSIARTVARGRDGKLGVGSPKSGKGVRRIALGPVALAALKRRSARSGVPGGYVWPDADGGPGKPPRPRKAFRVEARRVGVPEIRLHDLRHTAVTLSLALGVPLAAVADRAGHSSIAITKDRYGHFVAAADDAAADVLGKAIAPEPVKRPVRRRREAIKRGRSAQRVGIRPRKRR